MTTARAFSYFDMSTAIVVEGVGAAYTPDVTSGAGEPVFAFMVNGHVVQTDTHTEVLMLLRLDELAGIITELSRAANDADAGASLTARLDQFAKDNAEFYAKQDPNEPRSGELLRIPKDRRGE